MTYKERLRALVKRLVIELAYLEAESLDATLKGARDQIDDAIDTLNQYLAS